MLGPTTFPAPKPCPDTLTLIGMPGSGKSTIGPQLARALGTRFVDLDRHIEKRIGGPIGEYFRAYGEDRFRALEAELLAEVMTNGIGVIATGGGSVLSAVNRDLLRQKSRVVWLDASPQALLPRLQRQRHRPLFQGADLADKLTELHAARHGLYRATAHHAVSVNEQATAQVVEAIIGLMDGAQTTGPSCHPDVASRSLPEPQTCS